MTDKYGRVNRRIIKPKSGRPALELVNYPLFSRKQFAAAAGQLLQFFKNLGASTPLDTNMPNDGFLPEPMVFDIFGMAFFVEQGLNEADLVNFYNNSVAFFAMSTKQYLHVPMHMLPSGGGLTGFSSLDAAAAPTTIFHATNCVASPQVKLNMDIDGIPLPIVSQQDWFGQVQTLNAAAFTIAFYGTMKLLGVLGRPVL